MNVRDTVLGFRARERFLNHIARLNLPSRPVDVSPVTEADVAALPDPAQRYLRSMDVIGRPRDWSFRARFQGRFRMRTGQRWMPLDAWQYNTAVPVTRVIDMRIDVAGVVPMFGTDSYIAGRGRMHGKVLGLVTVADGEGAEFDLGELVTYLNDAAMLAPSMLLTPYAHWHTVDDESFDITLADAGNTVTARLYVDAAGRLTNFCTTDRWYAGQRPPVRTPWTTPIDGWAIDGARPTPTGGSALWHLPDGEFAYARGRFVPETIEFNVPSASTPPDASVRA
jgi:hypothetical protein